MTHDGGLATCIECCNQLQNNNVVECVICYQRCFACLIFGFLLGFAAHKVKDESNGFGPKENNKAISHTLKLEKNEISVIEELDKHVRLVKQPVAQQLQGSSFAANIRKVSRLSGIQHGLIEARGQGLVIVSIDGSMRDMLGWPPAGEQDRPLPTSVYDLLPEGLRSAHRGHIAKIAESGALPSSLMHPMRNLPIVCWDGTVLRVDICVGIITKVPLSCDISLLPVYMIFTLNLTIFVFRLVSDRKDGFPAARPRVTLGLPARASPARLLSHHRHTPPPSPPAPGATSRLG